MSIEGEAGQGSSMAKRFEEAAERSSERERSLSAVRTAVEILLRGNVQINGAPIEELIAREMRIEGWDRVGAEHEVVRLLKAAEDPLNTAIRSEHSRGADARSFARPAGNSDEPFSEQMH